MKIKLSTQWYGVFEDREPTTESLIEVEEKYFKKAVKIINKALEKYEPDDDDLEEEETSNKAEFVLEALRKANIPFIDLLSVYDEEISLN